MVKHTDNPRGWSVSGCSRHLVKERHGDEEVDYCSGSGVRRRNADYC